MFSYLCTTGPGESDMDLDLLAESESDSESSHSNQDNVSIQRSAVTAATAGSDAGQSSIEFTVLTHNNNHPKCRQNTLFI